MSVARTLCGLAALAGTAANAAAQFQVLVTPTAPNKMIHPAPPWILHPGRPGVVPAGAPAAAPQMTEVRPNWTGPQAGAPAAAAPEPAPQPAPVRPLPTLATPPATTPDLPAVPATPLTLPAMPPAAAPTPLTIPTAPAGVSRGEYRPAGTTRTPTSPNVWAPQTGIPATLPGTVVPAAARGR